MSSTFQLLNPPPVYEELVFDNKKASEHMRKYMTTLNDGIEATLVPIVYTVNGQAVHGMAVRFPGYTSTEIASIQNPENGMQVYNETTQKFNFRENGSWVEHT